MTTLIVTLAAPLVLLGLVLLVAFAGCEFDHGVVGTTYYQKVRSFTSLVGFWQLNDATGPVGVDSATGGAHPATYVNAPLPAVPSSAAAPGTLAFNQPPGLIPADPNNLVIQVDGARAEIPLAPELNTPAFTFIAVVRPQWDPADTGNVRTVATTRENPATNVERGWSVTANGSNQWEANICDGAVHHTIATGSPLTSTTDFLALTYDGTTAHLYVNVEERGTPVTATYVPSTVANLYIGEGRPDLPVPRYPFVGLIGFAAYFNEALALSDIADIAKAGMGM